MSARSWAAYIRQTRINHTGRWKYAEYLVKPLYLSRGEHSWHESIRIWKTEAGRIVAIVNSECPDENTFLHVDADFYYLEDQMLQWAEQHIALTRPDGSRTTRVMIHQPDTRREALLANRSYEQHTDIAYLKWQLIQSPPLVSTLPKGYHIKSFADDLDIASRFECAAKAFDSEPLTPEIYAITQSAPSYRPDLDICVVDDQSNVVSCCTVWPD